MSWTDTTDITSRRHTYGHEYGKTTRIVFGDHVRYGGMSYYTITDPADTYSDADDPSSSYSDANDPSSSYSDVNDPDDDWVDV